MSTDRDERPEIIREFEDAGLYVTEISGEELGILLGGDLGSLLDSLLSDALPDLLARATPHMHYPKRNSREYKDMMKSGLECEDVNGLVSGIKSVWDGYGWIGLVDFMGACMVSIAALAPDDYRDAFGLVRIDKILRTNQDEAELMETAVKISNDPEAAAKGMDFTSALNVGLEIVARVDSWFPYFQQALNAACRQDHATMRAALSQCPGLKDADDISMTVQGVFVLGLAQMAVARPHNALTEAQRYTG